MKLALISAGLFLLSYVVVNRGLGENPLQLIVPLLVAVASAIGARWLMGRGRLGGRTPSRARLEADFLEKTAPQRHAPRAAPPLKPPPKPSGASSGGKARKLF